MVMRLWWWVQIPVGRNLWLSCKSRINQYLSYGDRCTRGGFREKQMNVEAVSYEVVTT